MRTERKKNQGDRRKKIVLRKNTKKWKKENIEVKEQAK